MTDAAASPTAIVDVLVIGAGAAGLTAAIFAARGDGGPQPRDSEHPSAPSPLRPSASDRPQVLALDSAEKPGAKILVAGGGRCNVTHRAVSERDFCGGSRHVIRRVLESFPVEATLAWFREIGVPLKLEETGKYFPESNRARTVLDALLSEAARCGVRLLTARRVVELAPITGAAADGARFVVRVERRSAADEPATQETYHARRVILATGGQSLPKTGSDGFGFELARRLGHTIVQRTPSLVPMVLDEAELAAWSGVSHEAEITIRAAGEKPVRVRGSVLWTHFGLSGPAMLDASRHWLRARVDGRAVEASLSFAPGTDLAAMDARLTQLFASQARAKVENALRTVLNAERIVVALLARAGTAPQGLMATPGARIGTSAALIGTPAGQVSREARRALARLLTEFPLRIRDSRGYNYAEATAGGVELTEIDPRTMESRVCPGLHLVGEILDVDGRIGGFNFQWAWASGRAAGKAITRSE
ncbi:MAG: aminoacetone oxidase family FAD-binding enzyme [Phycisphaerae bacterium]|nr:aminoacetone oxidase family FAD-binding enzyme [Phycisphaerae bacterium]